MLKFLFGMKRGAKAAPTQREIITKLVSNLNTALAELPEKPAITFHPDTGAISLELPDQLPDEALALPAPEEDRDESKAA